MWTVLLKILAQYAWTYLLPLLFALLEKKFGKGLMTFIMDLIGERHTEILEGKITPEDAEAMNLRAIREVTKSSPGLSSTWAKLLHTVAYLRWVQTNVELKFEWWMDSIVLFEYSGKNKTSPDFMSLYTSRPDLKK